MLALYNVPMPFIYAGHRWLHLVREPYHAFILSNASIITKIRLSTSLPLILTSFLSRADNTSNACGTVPRHVGPIVPLYSSKISRIFSSGRFSFFIVTGSVVTWMSSPFSSLAGGPRTVVSTLAASPS